MQQRLFDIPEEKPKLVSQALIINTQQEKLLSKQQQSFNRLVKKIEKLRVDLTQLSKTLDESLNFYLKHIHPLEQQINELHKESVKLLFIFFKNKKPLSKKERHFLGGAIAQRLDIIFGFERIEPDDEMKEIFKAIQGISYEKAMENDFDSLRDDMKSMFEEFDVDMNFDDIHNTMTEEEMMQKAIELEEQFKQQANEKEQQQSARIKTKKQKEKEEKAKQKEEVRTKNIKSIYKQLAKILHPDLEQNEELKLQKEELMKQLTNAYENNDLHTLLNLELTWIQNEENNLDKLTDDKLEIYNEVLKEQIAELEDEIEETVEHPRYQVLQKFTTFVTQMRYLKMGYHKQQMENSKNGMEASIGKLKGNEKQALLVVKKIIYDFEMVIKFRMSAQRFR
ncbi:MAG: hypothetical protein ABIN89_22995 [Chitinophagaceae bacterium]